MGSLCLIGVYLTFIPIQDMFFDIDNYEKMFEEKLNKYFVLAEKQIIVMKIHGVSYSFEISSCVGETEIKYEINGKNITVVCLDQRDFTINFSQ